MIKDERDVMTIFSDSREISDELRAIAQDLQDGYWLEEAATHIDGLYKDACDMQRTIVRLRAELALARAAGGLPAEQPPG